MGKKRLPWYRTIVFKLMGILIITLVPALLIFGGLYQIFQRDLIQNLTNNTFTRDEQIFLTFNSKIEQAEYYVRDLYRADKVTYLSDIWDYCDSYERVERIAGIQERMQWYQLMEGFIADMRIYLPQRGICILPTSWSEMDEEDIASVDTYIHNPETLLIDRGNVQLYMGDLNNGSNPDSIRTICRMTISNYRFQNFFAQLCEDKMAEAIILIDGTVLMESIHDQDKLNLLLKEYEERMDNQSGTYQTEFAGEKYFCTYTGDFNHRINVICCRRYNEVFARTKDSYYLIIVMIMVNCLVLILAFLYVRRYIKRPISVLNEAFYHIKDGKEEVLIEERSRDEFEELYMGFNEMSRRLTLHVRDNYLNKISLQREQLKQLQAQINPHFLYNTLLFIKIRIKRGDTEGAERLTGLLSEYFRFINKNKRDVISLEEELRCVCTYMEIQTERFSNRFRFTMQECPEDIKTVPVPRLLLQPLVENAVKYGMERIEENGWVNLYFARDKDKISVIVEESGMEISQQEVEEMNARLHDPPSQSEVTSTINIDQRIKLYYGEEYELRYEVTEDGRFRAIAELDGGKKDASVEGACS